VNAKYYPARLAKWDSGDEATGTFAGRKYTNQLWRISGDASGYRICNYYYDRYNDRCLRKWGFGDGEVGTSKNAADKWRVTPLFSNALLKWNRIKEFDNTRGQIPIVLTVTYQVGVSTSTTDSKFVEVGTELSLAVEQLGGMSSSFKSAIESSTTNGRTEIQTEETEFTIDAGEHWWLCQGTATLDSWRGRKDVQIISSQFAISTDAC